MKNPRKLFLILIDTAIFASVLLMSWVLIQLSSNGKEGKTISFPMYLLCGAVFLVTLLIARTFLRIYANVWRYANSRAYLQMVIADFCGGVVGLLISYCVGRIYIGLWQSAAIVAMFNVLSLSSRFAYQQFYRHLNVGINDMNKIGVAIVGAGQVGSLLAEELLYNSESHYRPVCFIDKNPSKIGSLVCGLKVYAEGEDIIDRLRVLPVQEVFLALPSLDGDAAQQLHDFYSRSGCKVKIYDYQLREAGDSSVKNSNFRIREIRIEDLLFRNSLKINNNTTMAFYSGKIVMVTGGGGSIGSELCRQIAKHKPARLIILDIYENNAYDIEQELHRQYGASLNLAVEIASVRDRQRLEAIFDYYRPDVVFHAAAHKHVPLMEHSGCEAIKNNIIGTYNAADMAEKYGVKKFILISTDKAVNPTNIMGASKRMCEMVVQCRNDSKTTFAAVRFGNVLGSNGSVIPLFRRQIEQGGPVTITDKRIVRYFMTIPEASQLVMQAGAMAKSGELFVLDMGKPVKILDLAENMIRLSGLRPYKDIAIQEIGLRPGEKLYEELLIKTENLDKTDNNMIFIERDTPLTRAEVEKKLEMLKNAVVRAEHEIASDLIKQAIREAVPTYRDPEEVNCCAADTAEMKQAEPVLVGQTYAT